MAECEGWTSVRLPLTSDSAYRADDAKLDTRNELLLAVQRQPPHQQLHRAIFCVWRSAQVGPPSPLALETYADLHSVLGGFGFLSLYLAGGVFTSIASLAWQSSGMSRLHASQGASGAIYATLAFYAMVFPKSTILLFFIIPMPAWVAVAGFMAVSIRWVFPWVPS